MKQKYYNIFVLFLATIIFFVGAGVTVVDLCCSKCVDNVLSMDGGNCSMTEKSVESPSCCSEGNQPVNEINDVSLCVSGHTDKCCEAKRVSIDLERSVYQTNLLASMIWTVVPSFFCDVFLISDSKELLISGEARDPIPTSPRSYLSLIRVLII